MIAVLRVLVWIVLLVAAAALGLWLLAPRETVEAQVAFDPVKLPDDLDAYLADAESGIPNLKDGVQRRIVWAGEPGTVTPLSVVYIHGFSATSEEIRPVPDNVATALGANLHYLRLAGHGRDGAAMVEPDAGDWIEDTAEALEIGRRIGERVLVIATSTGGTLAALAAADPDLSKGVAGVVLVSPNFRINNPQAGLLTLPLARLWVPLLAGKQRSFEPVSEAHRHYWTQTYPTEAIVPMAALVKHVSALDFANTGIPALFLYSEADQAVDPEATHAVFAAWGGPKEKELMVMGDGDDPGSHVIAGDIVSPGQTQPVSERIITWAKGL